MSIKQYCTAKIVVTLTDILGSVQKTRRRISILIAETAKEPEIFRPWHITFDLQSNKQSVSANYVSGEGNDFQTVYNEANQETQ